MTHFELFFMFFRIGLFTIGGGYAMIPLIKQGLVGVLEIEEITNIIAIAEMSPGPFAVNTAAFVGTNLHGLTGSVVAVLGLVSPSIIIVTVVALFFFQINKKPAIKAALGGIRPVVWALIIFSTVIVAQSALYTPDAHFPIDLAATTLFILAFFCMRLFKKISPVVFVAAAGVVGAFLL